MSNNRTRPMFDTETADAYTTMLFGDNARRVPIWMYVQHMGEGIVSLIGASRTGKPHPLRYGSTRTHQFIVGEAIIRPHLVVATDGLRGEGTAGLTTGGHDIREMLRTGEIVIETPAGLDAMHRWQAP